MLPVCDISVKNSCRKGVTVRATRIDRFIKKDGCVTVLLFHGLHSHLKPRHAPGDINTCLVGPRTQMGNSTSTTDVVGIARYSPVDSGGFDDCQ